MGSSPYSPFGVKLFMWAALVLGGFVFCKTLLPCILPFLLGYAIAYLLRPGIGFLKRHGWNRSLACYLVAGAFYLLFGYLLWLLCAFAIGKLSTFATALPELYRLHLLPTLTRVETLALSTLSLLDAQGQVALQEFLQWGQSGLSSMFTGISASLLENLAAIARKLPLYGIAIGFTVVSSVIISTDYDHISSYLAKKLPQKLILYCKEIRSFLFSTTGKLARAYLIIMAVTFAEVALGLWLLDVSSFLGIAALIAILDALPVLGSGIALVPWGIWMLLEGNLPMGVGLLFLFGIVAVVRSFLEPKVVGERTGLHPLATLIAMYCGIRFLGFGGIILAPLLLMLLCHLHKKGLIPYSST